MRITVANLFSILCLCGLWIACSPYKKNLPSKVFHNTTAHYNAYWIANEKVKEIEQQIENKYQWNYNRILPIFPQFDSTDANSFKQLTEDIVEKASIAIQRHPESKWVDDSYILVGRARFYDMDFPNAVETFKYVNTHSEDDNARHEALVALMRTFIENGELRNAESVSDFLKREQLNKRNLKELYLNRAYLYQHREDYDNMVANLVRAEPMLYAKDEPSRIYFLIGQVYQKLGFESEAYNNYNQCLKSNPPYELSFYAKLNMAQVTELANENDIRKARKYFRGLLEDEKNEEYKDKIYYEMANFEIKQDNIEPAIEYYKKSVSSSVNNQRQKALSYLQLSEIYFDRLKDYRNSKLYYDSTLATMPKDEEAYESVAERQAILKEFVAQLDVIEKNDSLLLLANMGETELSAFLDNYIEEQKALKEEEKRREKERKKSQENFSIFDQNQGNLISTSSSDATWYFYNPTAVSQGTAEFNRVWGNRPLEDNWRRAGGNTISEEDPRSINPTEIASEGTNADESQDDEGLSKESLMASIPFEPATQEQLLSEVEVALYNLGNIYYLKLYENESAAETFESLLSRFPESEYSPEVMYELYLIYKDQENATKMDYHKNQILTKYPESIYAKLIENPNYREESQAITVKLQKIYEKAYLQYQQGDYQPALLAVNNALAQNPNNDFSDNLELLRILLVGKTNDIYKYQYELNNFIKNYSESELVPYAEKLVKASEDYQINLFNSRKAQFVPAFKQTHFFVIVYNASGEMIDDLPDQVEALLDDHFQGHDYTVGNLILDEKQSMILVNQMPGKQEAIDFYQKFNEVSQLDETYLSTKFNKFVITEDNFNIFYQTKDIDAYLKFFKANY